MQPILSKKILGTPFEALKSELRGGVFLLTFSALFANIVLRSGMGCC